MPLIANVYNAVHLVPSILLLVLFLVGPLFERAGMPCRDRTCAMHDSEEMRQTAEKGHASCLGLWSHHLRPPPALGCPSIVDVRDYRFRRSGYPAITVVKASQRTCQAWLCA
jgi:hypothetical protein